MTVNNILEITTENTRVLVKTKGEDGMVLGGNGKHEEIPEFTLELDVRQIRVDNGNLLIELEADNDDVEDDVLEYLVHTCGYSWEEATNVWNKAVFDAEM